MTWTWSKTVKHWNNKLLRSKSYPVWNNLSPWLGMKEDYKPDPTRGQIPSYKRRKYVLISKLRPDISKEVPCHVPSTHFVVFVIQKELTAVIASFISANKTQQLKVWRFLIVIKGGRVSSIKFCNNQFIVDQLPNDWLFLHKARLPLVAIWWCIHSLEKHQSEWEQYCWWRMDAALNSFLKRAQLKCTFRL